MILYPYQTTKGFQSYSHLFHFPTISDSCSYPNHRTFLFLYFKVLVKLYMHKLYYFILNIVTMLYVTIINALKSSNTIPPHIYHSNVRNLSLYQFLELPRHFSYVNSRASPSITRH